MSIVHSVITGGQIWGHRIRMLRQVLKLAFFTSFCVGVFFLALEVSRIDINLLFSFWYYLKGNILQSSGQLISVDKGFWAKLTHEVHLQGEFVQVSPDKLIRMCERNYHVFMRVFQKKVYVASNIGSYALGITLLFFSIRGWFSKRKEHLGVGRLVSSFRAKIGIKLRGRASSIDMAGVPLIKGKESQHILISGGTGSGKTNCLHYLLPQVRDNQQKAIIVDTTGVFVSRYYDPNRDTILNLFDDRSSPWSPWAECKEIFDYKALAGSFIPSSLSESEEFWRRSAQQVFSSTLEKCADEQLSSVMTNMMLRSRLSEFCEFLQETSAASVMDISSEKTAASIRSVLSSFLSSFEFLKDTEDSFSIRQWVEDDSQKGWLFLSCLPDQRESMVPFLSAWLSISIRSLSGLDPDFKRRVWFVVDELASLQRLKELPRFVSEARKYGGCGVFSIQSPAQVEDIYGRNQSEVIFGNCGTKIAFYEKHFTTASKISKIFGEEEVKESQESLSYGAHEMRDGVNLSYQKKMLPLVSASDLQSMKSHEAFLSLPEVYRAVKVKFPLIKI